MCPGRKRLTIVEPGLMAALDALIEPSSTAATSPLGWTCRSTRDLAAELRQLKQSVRVRTVAALLHESGYDLRAIGGRPRAKGAVRLSVGRFTTEEEIDRADALIAPARLR